ncbi:Wzz/FepE/Etk N-terminal domain-containing protein [Alteromonas sp. CI.11.F.A3]|uniref:XrtA system polysaccharide chain length determinant n=1 Tax=Alteromonas sp. CI.11.F.A3 TaxID=3079555 RepID=UPI0029433466|nr:XrtA system polysaccharide chain length determinant [Alteromonas sp. CI.11.F.A3]WOI38730.1 Wzz/FepE/Etk N-terminal domain-containing protein [Alteromonas sp. CI.11.F.A3]
MQDFQQTLVQFLDLVKGIWIKKRHVIIMSWLLCPLGFIMVATLPDEYTSKAQVYVDTRSVLQPLLKGLAIQSDPDQEVKMMARTLLSRSNVEIIARESDLDITTETEREFEDLVTNLALEIQLKSTGRDNIYNITYRNPNAATAQKVVQETLDLFVEGSLGNNRRDTDTAGRFLQEQIAEYESRLAESEQRLAQFKRQYNNILPLSGTYYSRLQNLNSELENTQLSIRQITQQVESLNSQIKRDSAVDSFGVTNQDSPTLKTRYDERIKNLEEELDRLKLRFTELHPDVIETQQLLDSLEEYRKREIESFLANAGEGEQAPLNELTQEIKLEVSKSQSEIASLKVKELDLKNKIAELESKVDLIPQIEAESTALNRDYGITKDKYEELLGRREAADLSRRAEVSSEELQFRIIEPPLVPNTPSGPHRLILYTAVLFLGFGAGIGLAFIVSQLSPILTRPNQLIKLSDYPIWGTVTHLDYDSIKKRDNLRLLVFIISSLAIVIIYGVLIAAEIMNINVVERFL